MDIWGDPTRIHTQLTENLTSIRFEELVKLMADHDMEQVRTERAQEHIRCNLEEYPEKGIVK